MSFQVINLHAELIKLSEGQKTRIPVSHLAHALLDYVTEPGRKGRDTSVEFLERLFRLEDPRRG
jgi:hypothetical protein